MRTGCTTNGDLKRWDLSKILHTVDSICIVPFILAFIILLFPNKGNGQLGTPTLSSPANGVTVNVGSTLNFSWSAVSGATSYDIQWDAGTSYVSSQNITGTSLSITVQAVSLGSHTWRVRAKNASSTGNYSSQRTYTVALAAPTLNSPANGTTVNVGSTLNFSWLSVTGATSYDIEWDNGTSYVSIQNVTSTSLNITVQTASLGSHTWHVRAKNGSTSGAYSSSRNYTVTLAAPNLSSPSNGVNVNVGSTLNFSWSSVIGAASYEIEWDAGTSYASSQTVTSTSLIVTVQIVSVGSHTWHVRAKNGSNSGPYSSNQSYTVNNPLGIPTLSTPTNNVTMNVGSTVNFSWSSVSGATSYDIEWDPGTSYATNQTVSGTNLSVTIQAVSVGSHTWHVRARNGSITGSYSSSRNYTVISPIGIPALNTPTDGATVTVGSNLSFSWSAVSGATSYDVEWDAGTPYASIQNVAGTSLSISVQVASLGAHSWHVRARNTTTVGSFSNSRNYTVALAAPNLNSPADGVTVNVGNNVNFSWSSVTGATSYEIEWDAGTSYASSQSVTSTSIGIIIQTASIGQHTWHVRAKNGSVSGPYSTYRNYTVAGTGPTLGTPTLNTPANNATLNVGTTLNFSWSAVSGATSYDIEWDAGTSYVFIQNVSGTNLGVTLANASIGPHTWHVRAKNASNVGIYSTSRNYTVSGTGSALGTPTLNTPTDNAVLSVGNTVNFSWSAVSGATSYDIEWDAGTSYASNQNVTVTNLSVILQAASVGSHTWHVRAKNASGTSNYSLMSNYTVSNSSSVFGTPVLNTPSDNLSINVGSPINFTWSSVSGATSYEIEWDAGTPSVSSSTLVGTSLSTTAQQVSVGTHTWRVRAKNATQTGNYSSSRYYTIVLPCTIGNKWYSQLDPAWGNDLMNGNCLIKEQGCFMTDLAMILSSQVGNSEEDYTPKKLNAYLNANSGYSGNCGLVWSAATNMDGPSGVVYIGSDFTTNNWTWLDAQLAQCRRVVVNVKNGDHWVLVVGKTALNSNASSYKVLDPGTQYGNVIKSLADFNSTYSKGHSYGGAWKVDFPVNQSSNTINTAPPNEYTTTSAPGSDGFLRTNITIPNQSVTAPSAIQLRIFPNPATGEYIMAEFNNPVAGTIVIEIIDQLGRQNYHTEIAAPVGMNIYQLPLKANGIYFLRITTEKETITRKFVVSK